MTTRANKETLEPGSRREGEIARFMELKSVAEQAQAWFEDAVVGTKHREMSELRFRVLSADELYPFAQTVVTLRRIKDQERLAEHPRRTKAAKHIRTAIAIFKQMASDEREIASHIGLKMTGRQYTIERSIEDFETALRFCSPNTVNLIHALADAAQSAWGSGLRWDPKKMDWKQANVPQSKNENDPVAQVVVSALAFIGEKEKRSAATVEAVLKGRRR